MDSKLLHISRVLDEFMLHFGLPVHENIPTGISHSFTSRYYIHECRFPGTRASHQCRHASRRCVETNPFQKVDRFPLNWYCVPQILDRKRLWWCLDHLKSWCGNRDPVIIPQRRSWLYRGARSPAKGALHQWRDNWQRAAGREMIDRAWGDSIQVHVMFIVAFGRISLSRCTCLLWYIVPFRFWNSTHFLLLETDVPQCICHDPYE
mmetsp:Transcript_38944/g.62733  ORF Transcript_38944/g.62733 Transcript_38944/m.62733 type:complete len:206 (-) Transcript_38944:2752-3369(-)